MIGAVFGLLARLLVPFATAATLGTVLASVLMRLGLRWAERSEPMQSGPAGACIALLLGLFLVVGTISGAIAGLVLWALGQSISLTGLPETATVVWLWHLLVWIAVGLAVASAYMAAIRAAWQANGAAHRRWELLDASPDGAPGAMPVAPTETGGRNIVILCDGTSNRPDEMEDGVASPTNVFKLSKLLVSDEAQTVWYQPGVGSDNSSTAAEARRTQAALALVGANAGAQAAALWRRAVKLFEGAFASGITETIVDGYTEIVRQYRPGDRIYLVGFSRGAYTARCIAAVISRCGLLQAGNIRYAPEAVQIYRSRPRQDEDAPIRPALTHHDPAIHFVGVFDTVASLGVPLWGWWFRLGPIWRNAALATDPVRDCRHVYHALAMDEQRSQFLPTLYTRPKAARRNDKLETLRQVWFRGCHGDIGGGYARSELSDISLEWMMDAMRRHGLRFQPDARASLAPQPRGRLHSELERKPLWQVFGSWPRWHPVPGSVDRVTGTELHGSVLERSRMIEAEAGRFDMHSLPVGGTVVFTAEANRAWHRPGIVIESGGVYRLSWVGSEWRDSSAPACGPAGQDAAGAWDLRRWWTWNRRLTDRRWMELVITVAHPRRWPLHERGLAALGKLLFGNDPRQLRRQLAPVGDMLARGPVVFRNDAGSGLLYLFANDWWQTASNNSGGLTLEIERVADGVPHLVLQAYGTWVRPSVGMSSRSGGGATPAATPSLPRLG